MARTINRAQTRGWGAGSRLLAGRGAELLGLLAVGLVLLCGFWLVFQAKTGNPQKVSFSAVETQLNAKSIVELNQIADARDLLPALEFLTDTNDRQFTAEKIYAFVIHQNRQIENIGALGQVRVERSDIERDPRATRLQKALAGARVEEAAKQTAGELKPGEGSRPLPLLTPQQVREIKPFLVVRSPRDFRRSSLIWGGLFLLLFFAIHFIWRARKFSGDQTILPLIELLSGLGLILMFSLHDPLRDTMMFIEFAQGLLVGGAGLLVFSLVDWHDLTSRRTAWFALLAALGLSALLLLFGSGPGSSDAKVNLFGFQPVEFIKLFAVFFLAKYFTDRWEFLRERNQTGGGVLSTLLGRIKIPALVHFLPVALGVGLVLFFFFLQKDLGPALVLAGTFLAMFAVARKRSGLVLVGLAILLGGVFAGYQMMRPETVYKRMRIRIDPWENAMPNGDQIAQGFWGLGTGSVAGTGLGLGDPSYIPAGHTDLVLASLGEELGFAGLMVILGIYGLLLARCLYIAKRAQSRYGFFLGLGLTLVVGLQLALIAGGVLNLIPLSGVVTPFISFGKSSMIANCLALGIILALSGRSARDTETTEVFHAPLKYTGWVLAGVGAVVLVQLAYLQVVRADDLILTPVLTKQGDGVYRYQYNPRINDVIALLPPGTVYDRNGIPLATSDQAELARHREDYAALGIDLARSGGQGERRYYPFGGRMFSVLGDTRTRLNWRGRNYYVEREYAKRLKGFSDEAVLVSKQVLEIDPRTRQTKAVEVKVWRRDYAELLPLLRYRNRPAQAGAAQLLNRERDLHLSLDARLQVRTAALLRQQLLANGSSHGAAVVLDAATGAVLASVSYPWPDDRPPGDNSRLSVEDDPSTELTDPAILDRARLELYPPGSTFKMVTAMAAMRQDPGSANQTYDCVSLDHGWVGNVVKWNGNHQREVHDIKGDPAHGKINLADALVVSCNAYFAQLGTYAVRPETLIETANLFTADESSHDGIFLARPNTAAELIKLLPDAAYGQGEVEVTPFAMARVAATVANGGQAPQGYWVIDAGNLRNRPNQMVINAGESDFMARALRGVVERGTASGLRILAPQIAGKTGTAELGGPETHAWFAGFAPYNGRQRIAFAVLIEKGGKGGPAAGPVAAGIVQAAGEFGLAR
jgi:cell division protein FtsW (lipid II flippase)/cell division protein FtsI/penicillin-binding protein 2